MDLVEIAAEVFAEARRKQEQFSQMKIFNPQEIQQVSGLFAGTGPPFKLGNAQLETFLLRDLESDIIWMIPAWQQIAEGTGDGYFLGFNHEMPGGDYEYNIRYNGKGEDGFHKLTVWKKKTISPAPVPSAAM